MEVLTNRQEVITDNQLPIERFRAEILNNVEGSPVTIIQAETGAGKSTQVPQMLAEAGYDVVVTQPRRIAARNLALRVADEVGCQVGEKVGYHMGGRKRRRQGKNC